jgi:hypothetical protein
MRYLLLLTLAAAGLIAADATGTWTGSLIVNGENRPAHLVLKQEGGKLTGTAGPDPSEQHPIQNGKAEDGKLTFELSRETMTMKFALAQEGDDIKGQVTREREGQTQTVQLEVKRQK